jgi:Ala-tRNA(Pro) deacylase
LTEHQVPFETLVHPPAFTAQKRAKILHFPGRQVAKTVLLAGPAGYLLAVLPATHRVDTQVLARALGGPVRLADRPEIVQVFRDCEWGVVEPFGTLYGLQTLLDESVEPDGVIFFGGPIHAHTIRMTCRDFERVERPRRMRFARRHSFASNSTAELR